MNKSIIAEDDNKPEGNWASLKVDTDSAQSMFLYILLTLADADPVFVLS
jgi:hypothetical protein